MGIRHRPRAWRMIAAAIMALAALVPTAVGDAVAATPSRVSVSFAAATAAATAHANWSWPLAPPWRILRGFQAPATRYSAGHRGIDLAVGTGEIVLAPTSATVYFVGGVAGRGVLTLRTADGVLVSFEPLISPLGDGQTIGRGERIGVVGTGGHCDDRCLHVGVRVNGDYVSPLLYYGGVPRAVLLPCRQARGCASR